MATSTEVLSESACGRILVMAPFIINISDIVKYGAEYF